MELKVGMYVRTNYRKEKVIRKIVKIVEDPSAHDHYLIFDKPTRYTYYVEDKNFIAKKDAIDLIEVGDYVNGYRVTYVYPNLIKVDSTDIWEIHSHDIKSIVTKEQFESIKYEVE